MRGELQAHLNNTAVKLSSEIDTDNGLLVLLLASGVLTDQQVETCKAKGTRAQKVDAILDSLKRQPDDCYSKFCEALKEIGRKDLCDYLKQLAGINDADAPATNADSTPIFVNARNGELDIPDGPPVPAIKVTLTKPEFYSRLHPSAYPMNKVVRGQACIISVFKTKNYQDRHGTDADRLRLKALFKQLNFKVTAYKDEHGLKAQDILEKIKLTAVMDVDTCPPQCYVLIILCHGVMDKDTREEFVLGTDGEKLSKQTILDSLAAEENIRTTPCLVFFVCCREYEVDMRHDGVIVNPDRHFFVAFPCKEASSSYRHEVEGTCYARSLVKVFMEAAHDTELATLIEKVKIEVQKLMNIQIADDPVSTLKKKFYFFPGIAV